MIREISRDPSRRRGVSQAVLNNIPAHELAARKVFSEAVADGRFRTRSTVERVRSRHADLDHVTGLVTTTGVALAVSRGHFDPSTLGNMSQPDIRNVVLRRHRPQTTKR